MNSADQPQPFQESRPTRRMRRVVVAVASVLVVIAAGVGLFRQNRPAGDLAQRDVKLESRETDGSADEAEETPAEISPEVGAADAAWQPVVLPASPQSLSDKRLKRETRVITVSGVARDEAGKPVAGANVRLMTPGVGRRLASSVTTDAEGRFNFLDVELERERTSTVREPEHLLFAIIATAPEFGLAWHPHTHVFNQVRPTQPFEFSGTYVLPDSRECFFLDEPIHLEITLPKAHAIMGRVMSDTNQPVAEAEIQITDLRMLKQLALLTSFYGFAFPSREWLPERQRIARTDADGRFRIEGLPAEALANLTVKHPDFVVSAVSVATTDKSLSEVTILSNRQLRNAIGSVVGEPSRSQQEVTTGPLEVVLLKPRAVSVQVQTADRQQPYQDVVLSAVGMRSQRSLWEYLQTRSSAVAQLTPGNYVLTANPMEDSGYVTTYRTLEVTNAIEPQSCLVEVERAALVQFEVVDADSGQGIPDLQFWMTPRTPSQRQLLTADKPQKPPTDVLVRVQSEVYHPRLANTDRDGRLKVSLMPSLRRFKINLDGRLNYVAAQPQTDELELRAGETTKVRFELKRRDVARLIHGRCLDLDDRPVPNVRVGFYETSRSEPGNPRQARLIRSTLSNERGEYELGERPLSSNSHAYEVRGQHERYATATGERLLRMKPGFAMAGRVIRPDGQPLANATVLVGGDHEFATTDATGAYDLRGIEDFGSKSRFQHHLFVTHAEYGQTVVEFRSGEPQLNVQLAEPAVLRGKVVGPEAQPLPNVAVRISDKVGVGSTFARTNADGQFEVLLQATSRYSISVSAEDLIAPPLGRQWGDSPPPKGFTVADEGVPAVLGEVRHAPIIRMERPSYLTGHVVDSATGEPLRLQPTDIMTVTSEGLWAVPSIDPTAGLVRADGSFRLPATPGRNLPWLRIQNGNFTYKIASTDEREVDLPLNGEAALNFVATRLLP